MTFKRETWVQKRNMKEKQPPTIQGTPKATEADRRKESWSKSSPIASQGAESCQFEFGLLASELRAYKCPLF